MLELTLQTASILFFCFLFLDIYCALVNKEDK